MTSWQAQCKIHAAARKTASLVTRLRGFKSPQRLQKGTTMRSDMSKVLTERPRAGGHWARKPKPRKIRAEDIDDELDPVFDCPTGRGPISRKRVYGYNCKEFTDLIGPLRKYLRRQVGRPWNDVWSEICKTLDRRSTTGNHVFEHIGWEVELHTYLGDDGIVYESKSSYRGTPLKADGLFVHPETGILTWIKPRRWNRLRPKKDENLHEKDGIKYHRIDGIWYEEIVKEIDWFDLYLGHTKRTVYSKRQLPKKELRCLGLSNSPVC